MQRILTISLAFHYCSFMGSGAQRVQMRSGLFNSEIIYLNSTEKRLSRIEKQITVFESHLNPKATSAHDTRAKSTKLYASLSLCGCYHLTSDSAGSTLTNGALAEREGHTGSTQQGSVLMQHL